MNKQQENILISAAQLMDNKADSAHFILGMVDVTKLSELQYYHFITLNVRAKDKLYLNTVEDTVVFQAMNYFLKKNDAKYIPYACFASARVEEEQNNPGKAIEYYLEAVNWIDKTNNFLLNGDIHYNLSRLLYHTNQYESSLFYLAQGEKYYDLANCSYEKKIYVNEMFALNYLQLNKVDSSLSFLKSAENIAIQERDKYNERRVIQNTAIAYCDAKEFKIAKEKCIQALNLTDLTDSISLGQLYYTLGRIYNSMHGAIFKDSATNALYKAEKFLRKSGYQNDLIDLYELLSQVEAKNGNYERSSYYEEQFDTHTNTRKNNEAATQAIIKKYLDNTFQAYQAERAKNANERQWYYAIIGFLSVIILFGAVFYRDKTKFRKFRKMFHLFKKESDEERAKMELNFLTIISDVKDNCNKELFKVILQIKSIAKLSVLTDANSFTNKEVRNQVNNIFKMLTFEDVYPILNSLHDNLLDKLKADFPALSESEYRILCLTCCGLGSVETYKILSAVSAHSIDAAKTKIRKKVGIELYGSFHDFIFQRYGITVAGSD